MRLNFITTQSLGSFSSGGRSGVYAVGDPIPPHPDPLPRGEGIALGYLGIVPEKSAISSATDGLPLPWGEGKSAVAECETRP